MPPGDPANWKSGSPFSGKAEGDRVWTRPEQAMADERDDEVVHAARLPGDHALEPELAQRPSTAAT